MRLPQLVVLSCRAFIVSLCINNLVTRSFDLDAHMVLEAAAGVFFVCPEEPPLPSAPPPPASDFILYPGI